MNNSTCFTLKVLTSNENLVLVLNKNILIKDLKIQIASKLNCCASQVVLVYGGKILNDQYSCQEQCIESGHTVYCIMKESCPDPFQTWLKCLLTIPPQQYDKMQKYLYKCMTCNPEAINCFLQNISRILSQPECYCLCNILRSRPATECLMLNESSLATLFSSFSKKQSPSVTKSQKYSEEKCVKQSRSKVKRTERKVSRTSIKLVNTSSSEELTDVSIDVYTESDSKTDISEVSDTSELKFPCICESKNKDVSNSDIMHKFVEHLNNNPSLMQEFLCIPTVRRILKCMCESYKSLKKQESKRSSSKKDGCGRDVLNMLEQREVRKLHPYQLSDTDRSEASSPENSFDKKSRKRRGRSRRRDKSKSKSQSSRSTSKVHFSDSAEKFKRDRSRTESSKRSKTTTSYSNSQSASPDLRQVTRRVPSKDRDYSSKASFCPFLETSSDHKRLHCTSQSRPGSDSDKRRSKRSRSGGRKRTPSADSSKSNKCEFAYQSTKMSNQKSPSRRAGSSASRSQPDDSCQMFDETLSSISITRSSSQEFLPSSSQPSSPEAQRSMTCPLRSLGFSPSYNENKCFLETLLKQSQCNNLPQNDRNKGSSPPDECPLRSIGFPHPPSYSDTECFFNSIMKRSKSTDPVRNCKDKKSNNSRQESVKRSRSFTRNVPRSNCHYKGWSQASRSPERSHKGRSQTSRSPERSHKCVIRPRTNDTPFEVEIIHSTQSNSDLSRSDKKQRCRYYANDQPLSSTSSRYNCPLKHYAQPRNDRHPSNTPSSQPRKQSNIKVRTSRRSRSSSSTRYNDDSQRSEGSRAHSSDRASDSTSARTESVDSHQRLVERAIKTAAVGALNSSESKEKMETSFEPQLRRLSRMGYVDRKANIEALIETDGYVNEASKLLSKPPRY